MMVIGVKWRKKRRRRKKNKNKKKRKKMILIGGGGEGKFKRSDAQCSVRMYAPICT